MATLLTIHYNQGGAIREPRNSVTVIINLGRNDSVSDHGSVSREGKKSSNSIHILDILKLVPTELGTE